KMDLLLRWFERQSQFAGHYVSVEAHTMYPLVKAKNQHEVSFLIATLVAGGLLEERKMKPGVDYRITVRGWDQLHPARFGGVPGTCFVAMSYDTQWLPVLTDAIIPAIEDDCKYQVIRMDQLPHNDDINDRMIAEIRSAQFMVADFSGQSANVYYEAGF